MSETTDQALKKWQTKSSVEHEFIKSDRIELVEQANRFIDHMVTRRVIPTLNSAVGESPELTEDEEATYRAALSYLRRQFDVGHSDSHSVQKSVEDEKQVERQ